MDGALVLAPLLSLGLGSFIVYVVGRSITRRNGVLAALTAAIFGTSLVFVFQLWREVSTRCCPFWAVENAAIPVLQAEPGALLIAMVGLALGLLVALYSGQYLALDRRYEYYYPLLLALLAGMTGMLMAVDLFTLYMFTMLTSGAAYVLVAFRRHTETAIEAGFKYVIMGDMGAILILAGIGLLFRESKTLLIPFTAGVAGRWSRLGIAFVLAGYAIKAALVPAHTWLPDAHGRAPSSISALLSGIIIQANLYTLLKVALGVGWPAHQLGRLLIALAFVSMTVGNVLALMQVYGKRMLGYSSIAQVGYMMLALGLGLAYDIPAAVSAGLFLLVAHAAMKGLAFLCKGVCHFYCDATLIDELRGMVRRVPVTAGCFVVALAGLAGVPPLAGFMGKWQLLTGALQRTSPLVWLAIAVFGLNSLLSLAYYLPVIGLVLKRNTDVAPECAGHRERISVSPWMLSPIIALAGLVVLMGVFPQPLLDMTTEAAQFLLSWGR